MTKPALIVAGLLGAALLVLLLPSHVFAQGSPTAPSGVRINGDVSWANTVWHEQGDAWRLEVGVRLPAVPDSTEVPLRFEFTPTAFYERSLVDGDEVVERRIPLQSQQPLIEALDANFGDESSGRPSQQAQLSFKLPRAHGFEAGEYSVLVRDARSGQALAGSQTLTLQGRNSMVDRRSLAFEGLTTPPKAKPKPKSKPSSSTAPSVSPTATNFDAASSASSAAPTPVPTNDSPQAMAPATATPLASSVQMPPPPSPAGPAPQPEGTSGSCKCEIGPGAFSPWAALPWLSFGVLVSRRRRRPL